MFVISVGRLISSDTLVGAHRGVVLVGRAGSVIGLIWMVTTWRNWVGLAARLKRLHIEFNDSLSGFPLLPM